MATQRRNNNLTANIFYKTVRHGCTKAILTLAITNLLGAIFPVNSYADPYEDSTFNFRHLLTMDEEFLGPGRVITLAQDQRGFIWMGGDTGLARYDGARYRMFNYDENDDHSLSSDGVRDIEVDASGTVWVITTGTAGGLNRYDEIGEQFIRYPDADSSPSRLLILDVASDSENNIYLAKTDGIYILRPGEEQYSPLTFPYSRGGNAQDISGLFVDRKDRIWVRTKTDGLWLYDKKNRLHRNWRKEGEANGRLDSNHIRGIHQDSLGNIWVGTNGGGSSRISEDLSLTQTFRHDSADPASLASDFNSSISEDKLGNIWITQDNIGVSIYHPSTGKFTQLKKNKQDPASLQSNATQFIFRDRTSDLWLVSYPLGIDYLNGDGYEIIRKLNDPEDSLSISSNGILTIKSDHEGTIWIGTEEGLNRYDKKTKTFKRYQKNAAQIDSAVGLKSNTILSLQEDVDNTLWVGTYGGGLHKFNPSTGDFKHYEEKHGPGGYSGTNVWTVFRDSTDTIWVSSTAGIARYDRDNDSFDYLFAGEFGELTAVVEIEPGNLLAGTYWGLFKIDVQNNRLERIGTNNPLVKSQGITNMTRLDDGSIWIATTNGIVIMNKEGQFIDRLGIEQGLPSTFIAAVKQASDGLVWATTANGVMLIDPKTKGTKSLFKYDGLACDSYKRTGLLQGSDANMYLGGTDGLSIIPPQNFNQPVGAAPVAITGLSILNRKVFPGQKESPLKQAIFDTRAIKLTHRQNMFGLEFSNLNFKLAGRLIYEYKIDGLTTEWTQAPKNQTVTFANLNAGEYQFMVRAHEAGAQNVNNFTALSVRVKPALWLSLSAKIGYLFLAVFTLWCVYAARQLRQKKMEAERSADAKTEFFATMSHEIRTPLTGVLGMLGFALRDKNIESKTADQLRIAKANADVLLRITNDVLDITKIEAGKLKLEKIGFNLPALVRREVESFQSLADEKNLTLMLNLSSDLPDCVVGDPTRVAQAINKLINNAIKFTKRGFVEVSVLPLSAEMDANKGESDDATGVTIAFKVNDSGIGIALNNIGGLFTKFVQVDASNTRTYGGTGLGLAICKQLVQLMGGDISVVSELGKGSTFQFSLPFSVDECVEMPIDDLPKRHSHRLNILCAEDFPTNQVIVRTLVEEMGHKITLVENGLDAIEALIEQHYDLILMDGRMPKMDGPQAAKVIRSGLWQGKEIIQSAIPIIALTANASGDEKTAYYDSGMNDLVTKPIDAFALYRAFAKVITDLLQQGYCLPLASRAENDDAESGQNSEFTQEPQADSLPAVSSALHKKLVAAFKLNLSKQLRELELARKTGDFETLGRLFHGLKGSASHLGDEYLSAVCAELENAADAAKMAIIEARYAQFQEAIKSYRPEDA